MGLAPLSKSVRWALGGLLGLGLSFLTAQAADAATLRLGPDCGPTIQDCVDAAADGDTILVPAKHGKGKPNDGYYENVVVDKDVTIRGVANTRSTACLDPRQAFDDLGRLRRNKTAVIVDAAPGGDPGGDGFVMVGAGAAGATIECFAVRHGQNAVVSVEDDTTANRIAAIGQNQSGIVMVANGTRVLDSLVIGSDGAGLVIVGNAGLARGNWVRSVDDACIVVVGNDPAMTDNHARRCSDAGIVLVADEPKIGGANPRSDGNTADSTTGAGFVIVCDDLCGQGFVRGNTASNAHGESSGFVVVAGTPGFEVSGNRAFKNMQDGLLLVGNEMLITGNIVERNGTQDIGEAEGLLIVGDDNVLLRNAARFNKKDGFLVVGDGNELGDGTDANRNLAERNLVDGFDIISDDNELDNNLARNNEGEGIQYIGAGAVLTDNESTGNRIDCAAIVPPAVNTGNFCSDNSDFAVPPEVESRRAEAVENQRAGAERRAERADDAAERARELAERLRRER